MTISRSDNKVTFTCNGSTHVFTFEFPIIDSGDLVVTLINTATGEETVLTSGTNYAVAASDSGYGGGGTVTTQAAGETGMEHYSYPAGYTLLIQRSTPKTQLMDLRTGQAVDLQNIEDAFDKVQAQILDMQEQVDRSIKFPAQDSTALLSAIAEAASRADKFLSFDSSGNAQASSGPIVGVIPSTYGESLVGAVDADAARTLIGALSSTYLTSICPAGVGPLPWPGDTAPSGWLLCYGQAISKTTYAALFAVTGHKFGADPGGGNFLLPDMRGRIPLGKDDMGGTSANRITDTEADTLGASAGSESHLHPTGDHILTEAELPSSLTMNTVTQTSASPVGDHLLRGANPGENLEIPITWTSVGSGNAHNHGNTGSIDHTMPYLTTNYIIKY